MSLHKALAEAISAATETATEIQALQSIGAGCINRAASVCARDGRRFFVKLNDATRQWMFEAEADGLRELARANTLRVPAPLCSGAAEGEAYLVLEYLELRGELAPAAERLGHGLAALHRVTAARFGWYRANTIGATEQRNDWCDQWPEFWREHRLRAQLELATRRRGAARLQDLGAQLLDAVPDFFCGHQPAPSLLHGDLWSGNVATTLQGEAVVFDPAVYFGDREADLAMTELFGGFPRRFYDAYRDAWPLAAGYPVRRTLYNLYHVLNHFNLFGGAYLQQAEHMLRQLLSERR
jgi:fructosamine-3-kinase